MIKLEHKYYNQPNNQYGARLKKLLPINGAVFFDQVRSMPDIQFSKCDYPQQNNFWVGISGQPNEIDNKAQPQTILSEQKHEVDLAMVNDTNSKQASIASLRSIEKHISGPLEPADSLPLGYSVQHSDYDSRLQWINLSDEEI